MKVWVTYETADGFKKERVPDGIWTDDERYVQKHSPRWQWEEREVDALPDGVVLQKFVG